LRLAAHIWDTPLNSALYQLRFSVCGFHYAEFDVEDGKVLKEPVDGKVIRGLKSYPVKVEGENILVLLEDQKE